MDNQSNSPSSTPDFTPLAGLLNRRDALRIGALSLAGATVPVPAQTAQAASVGPGKAQSVIFLWIYRPNYCASCRNVLLNTLAVVKRFLWMYASFVQPTRISSSWLVNVRFGKICSIA